MMDFVPFPKIPRLSREITITEKIDGTNAQVFIRPGDASFEPDYDTAVVMRDGTMSFVRAGSRNRWLTHGGKGDNHGFGQWVDDHAKELVNLGPGHHFGEWWGYGIQRGYGLSHKRFSLFNVGKWAEWGAIEPLDGQHAPPPSCCHVVPVLYQGPFHEVQVEYALSILRHNGSIASPFYMNPEGIVIFHSGAGHLYKKTFEGDAAGKERSAA